MIASTKVLPEVSYNSCTFSMYVAMYESTEILPYFGSMTKRFRHRDCAFPRSISSRARVKNIPISEIYIAHDAYGKQSRIQLKIFIYRNLPTLTQSRMRVFNRVKHLIGYCDENTLSKFWFENPRSLWSGLYRQICRYMRVKNCFLVCVDLCLLCQCPIIPSYTCTRVQ